jgi:O-antigen ligase
MLKLNSMKAIFVVAIISFLNVILIWKLELSYTNVIILFLAFTVVFYRPELLLLLFVVATSTVTSFRNLPRIQITTVDIYFTDLLFLFSLFLILYKYKFRAVVERLKNPMTYSILLFVLSVVIAIFVSVGTGKGGSFTNEVHFGRPLLYYLLFIPVIAFIDDEEKLMRFVKVLIVLSIIVSIYILFTAVVGKSIIHYWLRAGIATKSLKTVNTGLDGMIIRKGRLTGIPGISFVVVILPLIIGLLIYNWKSKSVKLYYVALFLGIMVIIINFTRMVWVSYLFMVVIMWFMIRGKGFRYVKITIATSTFVIIIAIFLSFFVENISTPTAVQRIVETKAAMDVIEDNYLWGIGLSKSVDTSKIVYNDRVFFIDDLADLHNSYLNIVFKIGVFPLLVYIVMSIIFFRRCYRLFKNTRMSYVKGLSIGMFLSYFRIMINALSQHLFWNISAITPIVFIFALNEVLIVLDRQRPRMESKSRSIVRSKTSIVTGVK